MSSMPPTLTPPRLSSQERLLAEIRQKHPGYHPVVAMADLANTTENEALEFMCHKEVAKYTQTVDKHVEIDEKITRVRRVVVELFGAPSAAAGDPRNGPVLLEAPTDYSLTEALATAYVAFEGHSDVVERRTVMKTAGPVSDDDTEIDEAPHSDDDLPPRLSSRLTKW